MKNGAGGGISKNIHLIDFEIILTHISSQIPQIAPHLYAVGPAEAVKHARAPNTWQMWHPTETVFVKF